MFKVDLTAFADGIGCGCGEKGIKGETMCWEEEQVGGDRAGGGGNQEFHFECFMFEMPFRSPSTEVTKNALLHCWWECKLIKPLWRTVWSFLKKLKIELPYDPAIPLLGIYPEKTIIQKESCTTMFIAALFTIARTWKQSKCPSTDEWIKMSGTYIQWNITQP